MRSGRLGRAALGPVKSIVVAKGRDLRAVPVAGRGPRAKRDPWGCQPAGPSLEGGTHPFGARLPIQPRLRVGQGAIPRISWCFSNTALPPSGSWEGPEALQEQKPGAVGCVPAPAQPPREPAAPPGLSRAGGDQGESGCSGTAVVLSEALPCAAPRTVGLDFRFLDYFSVRYEAVKGEIQSRLSAGSKRPPQPCVSLRDADLSHT